MSEKVDGVLGELQRKIYKSECFKEIALGMSYLPQGKKEKYVKLGVYSEVADVVSRFCTEQAVASIKDKVEEVSGTFTPEEVKVLKDVARTILSRKQGPDPALWGPSQSVHTSEQRPVPVPLSPNGESVTASTEAPRRRLRHVQKIEEVRAANPKELTVEETQGHSPQEFVGRKTRTLDHSSLAVVGPVSAPLPPYSLVEILGVEGQRAKIKFLSSDHVGEIDLSELSGFEY